MATIVSSENFTLALLCGGRSQRLGTDKGLYMPLGGISLICRAIKKFAPHFAEILVITKDQEQTELYQQHFNQTLPTHLSKNVRLVADESVDEHATLAAATGIITALKSAHTAQVLVSPVDQVGLRIAHLEKLLSQPTDGGAAYSLTNQDILPFPSLWPKTKMDALTVMVQSGCLSVKSLVRELNLNQIDIGDFFEDLEHNTNTPADMRAYFGEPLDDNFNRRMTYLRLSLTQLCNMSCSYCMPNGNPELFRQKARLSLSQIQNIITAARRLGMGKIRLTGGEPTLHPACFDAVRHAGKQGFEEICLTTNGLLLDDLPKWRDAGLTNLNISLDTLRADRFYQITRSRQFEKVMQLIDAGTKLNLKLKVNAVLLKDCNGDEAEDLIDWALCKNISLRFIELMPTGSNDSFDSSQRVSGAEIQQRLEAKGLRPKENRPSAYDTAGPERVFQHPTLGGSIGLINPISTGFCDSCNRLRITAEGRLRLCLFGNGEQDLDLSSADAIAQQIRGTIGQKRKEHGITTNESENPKSFRSIGG